MGKSRISVIGSLVAVVGLLTTGCGQGLLGGDTGGGGAKEGPITLGMLIPQSGSEAAIGPYMKNAAQLAVDEINGQVIDETLREGQLCDQLGMEMLWLAEHHFDGICAYVDPVSFAAALAASTKRIRIGFAVAQMSLHHPIRMAEQMTLIDNISHGRLVVGLGRGTAYNIYDYQG